MTTTYQDYTVSNAADPNFLFVKNYLDIDHVRVFRNSVSSESGFVEVTSDFTTSGTETNLTVTLTGASAAALTAGDIVRVKRITPSTPLVTFAAPTLSPENLNLVVKQVLYLAEEAKEFPAVDVVVAPGQGGSVMQLDDSQTVWDGEEKKLSSLADPTSTQDALTLGYALTLLQGLSVGDLADPALDNVMLYGQTGNWAQGSPAVIRSILGLGAAAVLATGTADGQVPTVADAKSLLLQISNNLSDLASASTARSNLGLGTAAELDTGTGASEVVQLDGSAKLPAVDGSQLDLSANAAVVGQSAVYALKESGSGANPSTGALTYLTIAGTKRLQVGTAGGDQSAYNGGGTVNAATGLTDNNSIELNSGASAVFEVDVHVPLWFAAGGSAGTINIRTTPDTSGASGWTTVRSISLASSMSATVVPCDWRFIVTGDALVAVEFVSSGHTTASVLGGAYIALRRLAS